MEEEGQVNKAQVNQGGAKSQQKECSHTPSVHITGLYVSVPTA